MNFRGTKIFDEYNEEDFRNNNNRGAEQRVSISKYMDKDSSNMNMSEQQNSRNFHMNNNNNNSNSHNNIPNEDSFTDNQLQSNNHNQKNFGSASNNLSDKISIIKILISNYMKEKELDTY